MSVNVEKLEGSLAKLTVEIPVAEMEKAQDRIYNEQKGRIQIPGFRRGKATRKIVERLYGKGIFLEDAVNDIVPQAYEEACDESGLEIVSEPRIEYTQVEPDQPVIFEATVAVRPEVVLGEYKGLEVETEPVEVTEDDVMAEIRKEQDKNAAMVTVEDRPVQNGDEVELDFDGSVDGQPFEGGHGEDYSLEIGSHSFIDNFEEQLIGAMPGEEREPSVTFPENYQEPSLAGKPALFRTKIKTIREKELPELDDEFASEVSEFETMEEYRADVRKTLEAEKADEARRAKEDALVAKAVENAQMEIPDLMVESQARSMVDQYAQRLQYQGIQLEEYLQYTGQTTDDLVEENKEAALTQIQSRLLLEAVAEQEQLTAEEADMEKEMRNIASEYGMTFDQVKENITEDQTEELKSNIVVQKAVDLIYDTSK